jgi:hypothetical protein
LARSVSRHYTAYITLFKGLAEALLVLSNLRVRRMSRCGAEGIDDVHVDCMPKQIIIINIFMEGWLETRQGPMKKIETFCSSIGVNISSLQSSFVSDVICWLWRIPRDVPIDTHDTPPDVFEVLSRTFTQRSKMIHRHFKVQGR